MMGKECMNEKKRYKFNYNRLRGKIKECYDTQEKFADELGIGRVSLSQRLSNKLEFTQDEILRACQLLNIDWEELEDYFFSEVYVKTTKYKKSPPFNN